MIKVQKINNKLVPYTPPLYSEAPEVEMEPTLEERLEAVESALLEQLLKEAN